MRGRLEVRSGVEAHQISEKKHAVKDCKTCHQEGSAAFESVVVSIAGPDGRPIRHSVNKEVLSSATALQSIRGFYAIGGTRIWLLDLALVLVVSGAAGGVLVHLLVKRGMRGYREKRAANAGANAGANNGHGKP